MSSVTDARDAGRGDTGVIQQIQRQLMVWHRRHGPSAVVMAATLLTAFLSFIITGFGMWFVHLAGNLTRERLVTSMAIGLVVPLLAVPVGSMLYVGLLAELEQANSQFQWQSRTDSLTEVLNRRGFFTQAVPLLEGLRHRDVVLCMVDVNRFKQLNDEYGHDVGDRALVTLAQRMTSVVGPGGLVARLGGDEFTMVIPDRRDTAAFRVALAQTFRAVELDRAPWVVSASCGVTALMPGDTLDGALSRADVDLYQAKALSRAEQTPRSADSSISLPTGEDTIDLRDSVRQIQAQTGTHRGRHRRA